ncbi:MAG: hypothetical protein BGO77_03470 [Caedibacter sp. 37-49]|nr:MAG: hypothetical protein BGO77_03470 [Caedibacter sp. 37-49]
MKSFVKAFMISLLFGLTACQTTITQNELDLQVSPLPEPEPLQEEISIPSEKRKVGVLLPLSGSQAALGQALRQATELSFFEHPAENLELVYKDTEGTSQGAAKAAQECLQENVEAILGPVFATEVKAIKPLVKARQLPVLSFSNDKSIAGQGVFVFGFSPQTQVQQILHYAAHQNIRRIAALVPKTPYGNTISQELKKVTAEKSMTLVGLIPYEGQGENLKTELDHLKQMSYDALFIPVGGEDLLNLFNNLNYYSFDHASAQLLGTTLWETKEVPPYLIGSWYPAPTPDTYTAFEDRFERIYGATPKRMASLGYDAVVALSLAIRETPDKRLDFKNFLNKGEFYGANGAFRLKEDGTVDRAYFIFKWKQHGPQPINSVFQSAF